MELLLSALRAAGEQTRLRLLAVLAQNELTVSELTQVLRQSQPRISRHLKLLCEARLLERFQEGAWVFYRLADRGPASELAQALIQLLPEDDPELARDRRRLEAVRARRAEMAAQYFRENALHWDKIRSLYIEETAVEDAMLKVVGDAPIAEFVDLGTGTGRILQVFGHRIRRGLGIDLSREMLSVARANLESMNLSHCQVRLGDIYNLTLPAGSVDVVTIHHVLHFLDDPGAAIAEAAYALRPGGRLLIVDFAPHELEFLRTEYAHRRLGFSDQEVFAWCKSAGLIDARVQHLTPASPSDGSLTVSLWSSTQNADAPSHYKLAVA